MSNIYDEARASLFVSDYAAIDAAGKINALGMGFQVANLNYETGLSSPLVLSCIVEVPLAHVGENYAFEVQLFDDADEPVMATGPTGEEQLIRIAQSVDVERPSGGIGVPPKFLWPRFQAVVAFMAGLPLSQGRGYVWRLSIDGDTRPDWSAAFCVRAVPAGPVIG